MGTSSLGIQGGMSHQDKMIDAIEGMMRYLAGVLGIRIVRGRVDTLMRKRETVPLGDSFTHRNLLRDFEKRGGPTGRAGVGICRCG